MMSSPSLFYLPTTLHSLSHSVVVLPQPSGWLRGDVACRMSSDVVSMRRPSFSLTVLLIQYRHYSVSATIMYPKNICLTVLVLAILLMEMTD